LRRRAAHALAASVDSLGPWVALGILGIALGLGVRSTSALVNGSVWVDHTHRVIESLDDLARNLSEATNARRGFALTGDALQLDKYARAVRELGDAARRVRALTSDNPRQQNRLDALEPALANRVVRLDAALQHRRTHGFEPDWEAREAREGTAGADELSGKVAALSDEERSLLVQRERRTTASAGRTKRLAALGVAVSMALGAVVVVRLRREIRRREQSERALRESAQAIKDLNEGLERRVDERTAELRMANGELEAFSYSVVHDLRAPLRGMGSFAEVLLAEHGDVLSPDAQDSLREIHQNSRKMATLIDGLVSMSRIVRADVNRKDLDLTGLVRAVAGRFLTSTESRPAAILVVPEGLRAVADVALLKVLVETLLGNAWKFSEKVAAARIEVGAVELEGERVLFVRDNGAGFDMAYADKLFAPFGRLHTEAEFPGAGIGLATAKRIVQRHGGRIWAEGRVGEGAAFHFTLCPKGDQRVT
jgi:signal transduction histidine kinase